MKTYSYFRCITGLIGSVVALILGIVLLALGIKDGEKKGIYIGLAAIGGGILGLIICIAMLRSASKYKKK